MTRYPKLSVLIVCTLVSLTMGVAPAQAQNVFTVDAIGDGSDANPGDGTCATSGGDCSLRAAIEETNALPNASGGPDEIRFDISGSGPHTIQPQTPMPEVTDPVVIDGGTEPDFSGDPVVQIDGSDLSLSEGGLKLETGSGGSEILDLSLTNIPSGLAIFIRTDQNLVDGCWVGLAPDGTVAANATYGIRVFGSNNQIGDPNGQGNVIVGASTTGIDFSNTSGPGSQAQNNLIGETPSGTPAGNARGVSIALGSGGIANKVGGTSANEANRIVHNDQGVVVDGSDVTDNEIRGNQISDNDNLGIDLADDGVTANDEGDGDDGPNHLQNFPELPNAEYDPQADEVTVTYQVPSDPNESGSGASAYPLTVDFYRADSDQEEGEAYLGSDTYTTSDYNTSTSGPDQKTITFTPVATVTESDSLVATATDADGNTSEFSASAEGLGANVFTVNVTGDGSDTNPGNGTCATSGGDCTLRAAIQETNALANAPAGPDEIRFDISGAGPHTIQPQSPLPDVTDPVVIDGSTEPDFDGDPVIAIDGAGLSGANLKLENGSGGSSVLNLSFINSGNDIALFVRTNDNLVDGCWIGLAPDGTTTPSNSWGFRTFGSSNQIGDPNGSGNVIVGAGTGIDLSNDAPGNTVQNNLIGQTPSGDAAGNGVAITLGGGSRAGSESTIGGTGSNEGNVIAHSNDAGVVASDADMAGTTIRGNRLFANGGIGIDLGDDGVTPNDAGDTDDGENRLQNFPEIQNASYDAGANEVTVTYQVPSDPDASGSGASTYPLTVDLYKADADDEEGAAYLGTDTYTESDYNTSTSGPDPKTITFTPAASVTESDHVVATATDANGNTSEFSAQSQQLPVELVSLDAVASENSVRLSWQTASETNNSGFEVQRQSGEDEGWKQVGYIESKAQGGSTTEATSYQYTIADLPVGTHQFRLKQVDLDGSSTLTDPISVDVQMQEAVKLTAPAPNPVSTRAALSFAVKEQTKTTIALYNTLGQRVATVYDGTPPAGEQQSARIDATGLPSGMYFLRLEAGGETTAEQFTVVK